MNFEAYMKQMGSRWLRAWFRHILTAPKKINFRLRHEIHNPNISPCLVELTRSHESAKPHYGLNDDASGTMIHTSEGGFSPRR